MTRGIGKQRHNARRPKAKPSHERETYMGNYGYGSVKKPYFKLVQYYTGVVCNPPHKMILRVIDFMRCICGASCGMLFKPVSWTIAGTKCVYTKFKGYELERDIENPLDENVTGSSRREYDMQVQSLQREHREQTENYKYELDSLREEIDKQNREVMQLKRNHQTEIDNLCSRKNKLMLELEAERNARENLSNRLSKALSSQLTDNNPNIADLSDMNRPTKLAEQFSELYDNEWTNAYGVLEESHDEYATVSALLNILQNCFNECNRHAAKQLTAAKFRISGQNKNISPAECKHLKDEIKKTAQLTLPFISELIENFLVNTPDRNLFRDSYVQNYVRRCTELCWLMAVQDPPMAITVGVPRDVSYNKANYREYTKSGKFVKYVVWPAILIQDGGAVMAKGIVQCCDNFEESQLRDKQ